MARPRAKCRLPTTERNRHEDQMRVSYQVPRTVPAGGGFGFCRFLRVRGFQYASQAPLCRPRVPSSTQMYPAGGTQASLFPELFSFFVGTLNMFSRHLVPKCDKKHFANTFKTPVDSGQGSYPEPQCHCEA